MSLDYSFPLSTSDSSDSKAMQEFFMLSSSAAASSSMPITSSLTNTNQIHHFVSEKDDEYWSIDMLTFGHNGVVAGLGNIDTLNVGVAETPSSLVQGGASSLSPSSSKLSSFSSTSLFSQSLPIIPPTMKSVTATTSASRFASTTMYEQQPQQQQQMLSPSSSVVGSVDDDKRTKSREIARLRRMKKQNEAMTLTKEMAQLMFEYECFEHACETTITSPVERMIMLQQVSILSETTNDTRGAAMTCAVCSGKFFSEKDIINHLVENHSLENSKMSGEDSDDDNDDDDTSSKKSSSNHNAIVDKKRRRQERNAISARLSRQRKKLYILLLQTQIPVLRARLDRIRLCIPPYALKTALSLISKGGPTTFPYGGNLFPYELVSKLLMPSSEKMRMCSSFVSRKANYVPPMATTSASSSLSNISFVDDINTFDVVQPSTKKVLRSVSASISSPHLTEVSDCDDIALIQDRQQVHTFPECVASGLLVDESCFSFDITSVFSDEVDKCNTVAACSSRGMGLKREREDDSLLVV